MGKKLQLTIAEPCHENWDGMTPVEKGKFCGACQKQVVDFSNMSDRQVAEFFKKPIQSFSKGGSVCGRFMPDQLARPIEIPRKRIPWVKYFFQIALPAFLLSMKVSAQKTQGTVKVVTKDTIRIPVINDDIKMGMVARRINIKPVTTDTIVKPVKAPVESVKGDLMVKVVADTAIAPLTGTICVRETMGKVSMPVLVNQNQLEGTVVDEKGEPVAFASVETDNPGEGVMADANGYFKIKKSWLSKGSGLIFSSTGFESKKIFKGGEEYVKGKLYVQLKANIVLPEVVVTSPEIITGCNYIAGEISFDQGQAISITDKKDSIRNKEIKVPVEENTLLIYPNPVLSGTLLNLRIKNTDEGFYQLQLLNQTGQTIQQKEIWMDADTGLLSIDVPFVDAGSYFLVLTNKKTGKKLTGKIIIQ